MDRFIVKEEGFSHKHLCIRPRGRDTEPKAGDVRGSLAIRINQLEQQMRDALLARSTAHVGENRVLKAAFFK